MRLGFHRLLLVLCFLLAQVGMLAHGFEHVRGDDADANGAVCLVCLAAHDVGTALPSTPALTLDLAASFDWLTVPELCRRVPHALRANQRAPPFA